jgi:hypothetical protein
MARGNGSLTARRKSRSGGSSLLEAATRKIPFSVETPTTPVTVGTSGRRFSCLGFARALGLGEALGGVVACAFDTAFVFETGRLDAESVGGLFVARGALFWAIADFLALAREVGFFMVGITD